MYEFPTNDYLVIQIVRLRTSDRNAWLLNKNIFALTDKDFRSSCKCLQINL